MSFLSSSKLLLGMGQNLRPRLSRFIWSLFNLWVDKFIIFGLMLFSYSILLFSSRSFYLKMIFFVFFLNSNFSVFLNKHFFVVWFLRWLLMYIYGFVLFFSGVVCVIVLPFLIRVGIVCVVAPIILLWTYIHKTIKTYLISKWGKAD